MSHWAEINENNIVLRVVVGDNNAPEGDEGYSWLVENLGGTWIKTSYTAIGGKRRNSETGELTNEPGFRKNYAGIGYTYDSTLDAFIPPKPFDSWSLNEETCQWEAPIPKPISGIWVWNDIESKWDEVNF